MGFMLPRNPVVRMASRVYGLLRLLPFLMLSLARRRGAVSRSTMLLVLAAVVGYSANRFDVLGNAVPAMKAVGGGIVPAARALGAYVLEGKPEIPIRSESVPYRLGRVGLWMAALFGVIWGAVGAVDTLDGGTFPGTFALLTDEKHCRVWMVIVAVPFLPLEAAARLLCVVIRVAIRIAWVPCRLVVRALNYDLSKLAEGKTTAAEPPASSPAEPSKAPSLRSHWDVGAGPR